MTLNCCGSNFVGISRD